MIKEFLKRMLNSFGYSVQRKKKVDFTDVYLAEIASPKTVLDVGVGYGTPQLYSAYPDAHLILIEPLECFKSYIDKIIESFGAECIYKGLGEKEETRKIYLDATNYNNSTIFERTHLTKSRNTTETTIQMTTLDNLFGASPSLEKPILIKLDSEGCELEIIKGGTKFLKNVDTVICEASIAPRFTDGYSFSELVEELTKNGFYLYSIMNVCQPINELRPRFADLVFKKE